jgi:hypothetical protein
MPERDLSDLGERLLQRVRVHYEIRDLVQHLR